MLNIELIKTISTKENFAIYKIPGNLREKYHGNYILVQGVFSDYAIEHFDDEKVIEGLKECLYEGIFETVKEAELTVKYADAMSCLINLISGCKMFNEDVKRFEKWKDCVLEG